MRIRLASVSELPADNTVVEFSCGNKIYCVARVGGRLSAMDNECPHRGGPLGTGVIDAGKLICPWHGWQFNPETGQSFTVPEAGVRTYQLSIEGDEVLIETDPISR